MSRYLTDNNAELWLIVPGFDDLLLTGDNRDSNGVYSLLAQADMNLGAPQPIDTAVQRWMIDGAIAATQGHDNRTITFNVVVSADSTADLTAGEQALGLRSQALAAPGALGFLKWVSPQGSPDAPASVFEIWLFHISQSFDLPREMRLSRMLALTATAKPWVRSENPVTVPAIVTPGSPTTTQIDACTSITGWASSPGTTLSTSGGAVRATTGSIPGRTPITLDLARGLTVTGLSSTPYLMIDLGCTGANLLDVSASVDRTPMTKAAQIGSVYYFLLPTGTSSFALLDVQAKLFTNQAASVVFLIRDVSKTDTIGGIGSRKQLARTLDVGGSVKTSGSIHVASPSSTPLGTVLVHTSRDNQTGFTPALRQYRVSGGTTTVDSTCVSGNREPLVNSAGASAASLGYNLPAGLIVEGQYVLVGRFIFAGATRTTLTMTAGVFATTLVGDVVATGSGVVWAIVGSVALPGLKVPAESTQPMIVGITAISTGPAAAVQLDELYLLNVTTGDLSLINAGSSGAYTHLWLDSPDADPARNKQSVYLGTQADRSDAAAPYSVGAPLPYIQSIGDHSFDPTTGVQLFTVTDQVDNAQIDATFYERHYTSASS